MSTSTSAPSDDVLDTGDPGPTRPWRRAAVVVLAAAVVAGAAVLARDDDGLAEVSGTMVVDVDYRRAELLERSDQEEDRNGVMTGTLELRSADRTITGRVEGTVAFSMVPTQTGPVLLHAWGDVEVSLHRTTCRGAYGYSYYHDPAEAGGAVELRCDDGSVLGARMAPTTFDPPDQDHRLWRTTLALDDGWTTQPL